MNVLYSSGSLPAQLAPCMQPMRAYKGDYLIRQGEINDDLFFLLQVTHLSPDGGNGRNISEDHCPLTDH